MALFLIKKQPFLKFYFTNVHEYLISSRYGFNSIRSHCMNHHQKLSLWQYWLEAMFKSYNSFLYYKREKRKTTTKYFSPAAQVVPRHPHARGPVAPNFRELFWALPHSKCSELPSLLWSGMPTLFLSCLPSEWLLFICSWLSDLVFFSNAKFRRLHLGPQDKKQ